MIKVTDKVDTSKTSSSPQAEKSVAKRDTVNVPPTVIIDLEEKTTGHAVEKENDEGEKGGGGPVVEIKDVESPFIINKWKKKSAGSARKKHKFDKSTMQNLWSSLSRTLMKLATPSTL